MGGVRTPPPTFQKVGPMDSHENVIKLARGGVGQICQEVVSEILEKQAKNCFSRVGSKVFVSKKCSNSAGRGILSQSRLHIFKNFPRDLPPDPLTSNIACYLSLNMPLAIGIPVCCHC